MAAGPSIMKEEAIPETDETESDSEIEKLIKIVEIIIGKLGPVKSKEIIEEVNKGIINVDTSNEIAKVFMILFTCLRKEEIDSAGYQKYKSYTATIDGVEVSIQSLVDDVKTKQISINFLIATSIVELMTVYHDFFKEVMTGSARFRVKALVARENVKRDSQVNLIARDPSFKKLIQSLSQYGLNRVHIPLLQGITLAPERRTGVITSLGPLAQAILLVMEDNYDTKLSGALLNSLHMLPMAKEIVNCLKEARSPGQVTGILKVLGDILLLTTTWDTQKIHFPLLMIVYLWRNKPIDTKWSFSGAPMIKLYNLFVNRGMKILIKSGADKLKTAEVVFHSIFGAYLKDLGILGQITTHTGKWHQRQELNDVFRKRSTQPLIEVEPIKFKYIPKMAPPLLTNGLGYMNCCVTSRPSFSGFRKRIFIQEFLFYLTREKWAQTFSDDPIQLLWALRKTKNTLMEDKDLKNLLATGNKEWEEYNGKSWIPSTFIPVEGNIEFYGPSPCSFYATNTIVPTTNSEQ